MEPPEIAPPPPVEDLEPDVVPPAPSVLTHRQSALPLESHGSWFSTGSLLSHSLFLSLSLRQHLSPSRYLSLSNSRSLLVSISDLSSHSGSLLSLLCVCLGETERRSVEEENKRKE
jgi:hypothetical protein